MRIDDPLHLIRAAHLRHNLVAAPGEQAATPSRSSAESSAMAILMAQSHFLPGTTAKEYAR